MFNWLFQLFGKTDYKKLKKELKNEINQRRHDVSDAQVISSNLDTEVISSKIVKVFKDGNWEKCLITGRVLEIFKEEKRIMLENNHNFLIYHEELEKKEIESRAKINNLNKLREKIKQRKHSK